MPFTEQEKALITEAMQAYVLTVPDTKQMVQGAELIRQLHDNTADSKNEQSPSPKQKALLRHLGIRQAVKTKQEASRLISESISKKRS